MLLQIVTITTSQLAQDAKPSSGGLLSTTKTMFAKETTDVILSLETDVNLVDSTDVYLSE